MISTLNIGRILGALELTINWEIWEAACQCFYSEKIGAASGLAQSFRQFH